MYRIYVQVQPTAVIMEQQMLYEFSFIDSSMTGLGPRTFGQNARDHGHFGCQCQEALENGSKKARMRYVTRVVLGCFCLILTIPLHGEVIL